MKNYDETINSVFERIGEYEVEKKRKRKILTKTVTSFGAICLIALMGIGVWQSNIFKSVSPDVSDEANVNNDSDETNVNNDSDETNVNNDSDETNVNNDSDTKYLFAINEITGSVSAAPKYHNPELHYNEVWDASRMAEYLGVDLKKILVDFNERNGMEYIGLNEFTTTFENDGLLVVDRAAYECVGEENKRIIVLASKLGAPYDCIYQTETDLTTSTRISENNEIIELEVYAQNKTGPFMEYQMYVIDFEYGGVYYRITAENISPFELDNLICQIIKQ